MNVSELTCEPVCGVWWREGAVCGVASRLDELGEAGAASGGACEVRSCLGGYAVFANLDELYYISSVGLMRVFWPGHVA